MRWAMGLAAVGFLTCAAVPAAAASLVVNGSFEEGPVLSAGEVAAGFKVLPGGDTSITGWTVIGESVDWKSEPQWFALTGTKSIDLNGSDDRDGNAQGGIAQIVTGFTIGQAYKLSFWAEANPTGADLKTARATLISSSGVALVDSEAPGEIKVETTRDAVENWVLFSYSFVADATIATLRFRSLMTTGEAGVFIDDVSITAIPLPMALPMFMAGLGALGLVQRRRKDKTAGA